MSRPGQCVPVMSGCHSVEKAAMSNGRPIFSLPAFHFLLLSPRVNVSPAVFHRFIHIPEERWKEQVLLGQRKPNKLKFLLEDKTISSSAADTECLPKYVNINSLECDYELL